MMMLASHAEAREPAAIEGKAILLCLLLQSGTTRQYPVSLLWIALSSTFDLRLTPSALESGAGQRAQITQLIAGCSFAIVVLDGLRPNVTYEYGLLDAYEKPVILLKEKSATVDIKSLMGDPVSLAIASPALNVDTQFSNVKDVNHAEWSRLDPAGTIRIILQEYKKKKSKIKSYVDIRDPVLWLT
jgi:hypothetical protein